MHETPSSDEEAILQPSQPVTQNDLRTSSGPGPIVNEKKQGWLYRLATLLSARTAGGRFERIALVIAVPLLVIAASLAWRSLSTRVDDLALGPLIIAGLLGVPLVTTTNALEYILIGNLSDQKVRFLDALRLSIISTAANLLPVPGAALVRIQALRGLGATYRKVLLSTAVVGLGWLGTTCFLAGVLRMWGNPDVFGLVAVGFGALLIVLTYIAIRWTHEASDAIMALVRTVAVEGAAVMAVGIRFYAVAKGLSMEANLSTTVALTIAVVVASAVGFLPAGLGLREFLAAALAPLLGFPAAAGLLITAVDRAVTLPVSACVGTAFLVIEKRRLTKSNVRIP